MNKLIYKISFYKMMFGKKDQYISEPTLCRITEIDELKEIEKVKERLDSSKIVPVMAKRSRIKPCRSVYSLVGCKSIQTENSKLAGWTTLGGFHL